MLEPNLRIRLSSLTFLFAVLGTGCKGWWGPVQDDSGDSTSSVDTVEPDSDEPDTDPDSDPDSDTDTGDPVTTDEDGDGWTVANGDCNDSNPNVRPDAEEICDNLDNDCDGDVDLDLADGSVDCEAFEPGVVFPETSNCVSGIEVEEAAVVFDVSCPTEGLGIEVGSLINGQADGGYMRAVTSVVEQSDGRLHVETRKARLAEFFPDAFEYAGYIEFQEAPEGPWPAPVPSSHTSASHTFQESAVLATGGGLEVEVTNLTLSTTAELWVEFNVDENDNLTGFAFEPKLTVDGNIALSAEAVAAMSVSDFTDIAQVQLASGGFWVSVVWVSVDVELDLDAGYDLVAEAAFSVTGGAGASVEAAPALRYDGSAWSVSMPAPTPTLTFVGPTVDGVARLNPLQLYLKPELELVFSGYGMAWIAHGDATVSAKTFVGVDAEVTTADYAWSFYVGQEYAVGLEFDTWLTDEWDVEYPVYDWQTELASGGATFATCGDGSVDSGEACDGADLDGETCVSQGFDSGALACDGSCQLDSSACVNNEVCTDGTDNDADGDTDCNDSDCSGHSACVPSTETDCSDGTDNDADGDTDCNDSDCIHSTTVMSQATDDAYLDNVDASNNDGNFLMIASTGSSVQVSWLKFDATSIVPGGGTLQDVELCLEDNPGHGVLGAASIDLTVYQLTGGGACNSWDENNVYWGSHSCSTSTLTSFTWQGAWTDACFSLGSVNLGDLRDEGMAIGESAVSGRSVMFQDRENSSTYPALAVTYTECY